MAAITRVSAGTVGAYNATPPTLSDRQETSMQMDASGNTYVNPATLISGEDQTNNRMMTLPKYSYNHITTATTTVVKNTPGTLHTIVVNTTAAGTITVYDNTAASGTVVAILKASVAENTYTFDTIMGTGITVVTGAASDVTVTYL